MKKNKKREEEPMRIYWWQNQNFDRRTPSPSKTPKTTEESDCPQELARVRENFQRYYQQIQDIINE